MASHVGGFTAESNGICVGLVFALAAFCSGFLYRHRLLRLKACISAGFFISAVELPFGRVIDQFSCIILGNCCRVFDTYCSVLSNLSLIIKSAVGTECPCNISLNRLTASGIRNRIFITRAVLIVDDHIVIERLAFTQSILKV